MPGIFQSNALGTVVAMKSGRASPALVEISTGFGRPPTLADVIVTGVSISDKVAAQIKQTLDNDVFIHTFGDTPSQISIKFTGFTMVSNSACYPRPGAGLQNIVQFYHQRKLSQSSQTPIRVTVGGVVYDGFMIAMQLQLAAAGGVRRVEAQVNLVGWRADT